MVEAAIQVFISIFGMQNNGDIHTSKHPELFFRDK